MKRETLGVFVFWAGLLALAVCAFLLAARPTLIPTGIPGDAVAFGMGAEEVTQAAGPPDGTHSENGWRTGFFLFHYQREVLGCPAAVSYTFHGRQESKKRPRCQGVCGHGVYDPGGVRSDAGGAVRPFPGADGGRAPL